MGGGGTSPVVAALQNPGIQELVKSLSSIATQQPAQQVDPAVRGQLPQLNPTSTGFPGSPQQPAPPAYNTGGTQGSLPAPTPRPAQAMYSPPSGGEILASKLQPKGAAAYSGIQGVAEVLDKWNQRKEGKMQAEAANIAKNLMTALESNDQTTVHEILNDPHSTKVLNKVYKGWLVKDQEAKKQKESQGKQKPADPTLQGFEKGMSEFLQKKQGGQQPPTQGQQPSPQQGQQPQGQQPQGMPKSVGGYLIPQAGPTQLDTRAKENANIQANKDQPGRMVTPTAWDPTPKNIADMEKAKSSIIVANTNTKKAELQMQKSQADYEKALLGIKSQEERAKLQSSELNTKYQTSLVNLDIQKQKLGIEIQRYQNIKQSGANKEAKGTAVKPPSQQFQVKMQMLSQAEDALKQLSADPNGKITKENVTEIAQALKAAGAVGVSKKLTDEQGSWFKSYSSPKEILDDIKLYRDGMQKTFGIDEKGNPKDDKASSGKYTAQAGDPKVGDVVDGYKYTGGDPADPDSYEEEESDDEEK